MTPQEMEKNVEEVWALFRETAIRFQETDKKFQETDKLLSQKFQETDKKFQKTENEIRRVSENVDKLTGKWGRFVEGLVAPGVIRLFRERDIGIKTVFQRVRTRLDGDTMEIDILGVSQEHVVLVEVKSTLGVDDVRDHLERLDKFRQFLPEYADRKVIGAVAGIVIEENVGRFAYRRGLFVIGQSGDAVEILNDTKFSPRIW